MIARTRLTLQDYFDRAGLGPPRVTPPTDQGPSGFAQALATIQAKAAPPSSGAPTGLALADYLKAPLPVKVQNQIHPPAASSSPPSSPGEPETTVERVQEFNPDLAVPSSQSHQQPAKLPPLSQSRSKIAESIRRAAAKYRLPVGLIQGVIQAESDFQVRAVSPAGAQGLMQLMPDTARELGVEDPFDIDQNIDGGSQYLRKMLDRFDGNLKLALAAYNAGPGTVAKYGGGVPPFAETRAYVEKVLRASRSLSA
jgi:soluble lytic murein transglycosylase-like protein